MLSLEEKLKLWVSLTGIKPQEDKKKYSIFMDGRLSDWDIKCMNNNITNCMEEDETGLFVETYLEHYLEKFLKEKSISIMEILKNKDLAEYIDTARTLYDAIKEANASEEVLNSAKKAMDFYELSMDNLTPFDIVEIRRSALNCMNKKLSLKQFSFGDKGTDFKVSKNIYAFKSVDDLIICSAKGNLQGVSLAYIESEKDLTNSFFAFVIKNGNNLYLLSDMPEFEHPLQRGMTRCAGRDMSRRIESNFFPYDTVAGLDISDLWNSGKYGVKKNSNELSTDVNEDNLFRVIGNINSLSEDEALWFVMMLSFIKDKFYKEKLPKLDISYTKSMISSNLLEENEYSLVVKNNLPNFNLNEVTKKEALELKFEKMDDCNDYLVERYIDDVDDTVLNSLFGTDKAKMLEDKYNKKEGWFDEKKPIYAPLNMDLPKTKEQTEYDLKWIARHNLAKAVRELNIADYKANFERFDREIEEMIKPRLKDIVLMHLKDELKTRDVVSVRFGSEYSDKLVSFSSMRDFDKWYSEYGKGHYFYTRRSPYNKSDHICAFTGTKAGVVITINPKNADALALVCGITKDELPEQLRHFEKDINRYHGNHLLNNIDPFLWVLKDEYNTMNFDITIFLSKKQYLEFCKEAGVEAIKFWENEKPACFRKNYRGDNELCNGATRRRWENNRYNHEICNKCKKCKWYNREE